nr:lipoyl(octanoyl) transferase LipB [Brevibacterium sp. ACRRH]
MGVVAKGSRVVVMAFTVEKLGFAPDLVDYTNALRVQNQYHSDVVNGTRESTLLVLEHNATYTAGKRTEPHERPRDGTPVIDIDRGGKITWHGPGQLVIYPIYRLREAHQVRLYVDQIEKAGIELLAEYGIQAGQVDGRSGVWLPATDTKPERKILAIGIRIHQGVAMHGLALNCSNSTDGFDMIVPCGIADAGVTSISDEIGKTVNPSDVADRLIELLNTHITA